MKLERLQKYKLELASTTSSQWGEILFRLVNESKGEVAPRRDELGIRREMEDLKLKLTIAIGALEVYADDGAYKEGEPPEELAHLAQVTLGKIEKVNWLTDNRPAELG